MWESKMVLKKYKPKIVAVTGSVGKTSTKDAVYSVMSSAFSTRKNEKSFNSELGVPLTILGCKNGWFNPFIWMKNIAEGLLLIIFPYKYPAWLILEMGVDRPGDIERLTSWLKPDVSIITYFGSVPVHVEFFPSIDDLVHEKGLIVEALKPNGTFIFNSDERRVKDFAGFFFGKKIGFGIKEGSDVGCSDYKIVYGNYQNSDNEFPIGVSFKISYGGSSIPVFVNGSIGRQHIYPFLAAYAAGISQGINPLEIAAALEKHVPPRGRMRLIAGIKETLIIDDTYNSSPVAVHEALATLDEIHCSGRKIAVLGDMLELGAFSAEEHKKVGEAAAKAVDVLAVVGIRTRGSAEAALDAGMDESAVLQFENSKEAGSYLLGFIKPGDVILVKGSQSMRMEKTVEEIMLDAQEKEKLLIRQDKHWLAKK